MHDIDFDATCSVGGCNESPILGTDRCFTHRYGPYVVPRMPAS
jgi:hypothetical protein